jgi:hypothetical protein
VNPVNSFEEEPKQQKETLLNHQWRDKNNELTHQQVEGRWVGFRRNGASFHDGPSKIGGKRPQLRLLSDSSVADWIGNHRNCYCKVPAATSPTKTCRIDKRLERLDWPQSPILRTGGSRIQTPLPLVQSNQLQLSHGVSKRIDSILKKGKVRLERKKNI